MYIKETIQKHSTNNTKHSKYNRLITKQSTNKINIRLNHCSLSHMTCQTVYGTVHWFPVHVTTNTQNKMCAQVRNTRVHVWKSRRQHRMGNPAMQLCELCCAVSCDMLWGEGAFVTLTSSSVFETVTCEHLTNRWEYVTSKLQSA